MKIDKAGNYILRYTATDECGNETVTERPLTVENGGGDTITLIPGDYYAFGGDTKIVCDVGCMESDFIGKTATQIIDILSQINENSIIRLKVGDGTEEDAETRDVQFGTNTGDFQAYKAEYQPDTGLEVYNFSARNSYAYYNLSFAPNCRGGYPPQYEEGVLTVGNDGEAYVSIEIIN